MIHRGVGEQLMMSITFYVLDEFGQPTTVLNTECVNYRIYYMMKQLKKINCYNGVQN